MTRQILMTSAIAAMMLGCGGGGSDFDLNTVSGTVTMDGQPLANARVIFTPKDPTKGGRIAYGMTDESGEYELAFTNSGMGALPGEYVVKISTYIAPEEDPDTGLMSEEVPERVPEVYVKDSSLTATVPGENYDFELKSDAAEVVQPTFDTGNEE